MDQYYVNPDIAQTERVFPEQGLYGNRLYAGKDSKNHSSDGFRLENKENLR